MIRVLLDTDVVLDYLLDREPFASTATSMRDYEDAAQVAAAELYQLDAVVTRNAEDYANSSVTVLSPADLVSRLALYHVFKHGWI